MSVEAWGMIAAGLVALVAGLVLVRGRFAAASGEGKVLVLGPVFEAVALAMFAAEHFLAAQDLMGIVPRWLPGALFWTYFVGGALLAAAISFIAWRYVRWSASLLALLFLIFVATVDLPVLAKHLHERLFWTLTVRETAFAAGAMVLAGSLEAASYKALAVSAGGMRPASTAGLMGCLSSLRGFMRPLLWPPGRSTGSALIRVGRCIVAAAFVFYAIEHFLFPRFVPGVPLEKMTPGWMPAPTLIAYVVGAILLAAGAGLMIHRTRRIAAASAGIVLLLLTIFFYVPILMMETHSPLAVDGINYVGDTLLFAATALLAGFGADEVQENVSSKTPSERIQAPSITPAG